jgi:hypothetical protein
MMKLRGNKKTILLLLPIMIGFAFQATQYARAPVEYDFYVVYAKNADIAVRPGNDLSPNGESLLQNSTGQEGYYTVALGRWGPGYMVNYTDAFRIVNREMFDIKMIGFNFSGGSTGTSYLKMWVQNDTDADGVGDTWIYAWDGSNTVLNSTYYIFINATNTYGNDGGVANCQISIDIPSSGVGINAGTPELNYNGQLSLWFTSITF